MARIQVLELPTIVEGDVVRRPFALIVDQIGELNAQSFHARLAGVAETLGAAGIIVYAGTLDVARDPSETPDEDVEDTVMAWTGDALLPTGHGEASDGI